MNDNNSRLVNVLSSLRKKDFIEFIYQMWRIDDLQSDIKVVETEKRDDIGRGVLQQKRIFWDNPAEGKTSQSFFLIIPFFQPLELLLSTSNYKVLLDTEKKVIRSYTKEISERIKNWFWPQDGYFNGVTTLFVSNISGLDKQIYFDNLIPRLSKLVRTSEYFTEVGIGTYDSFLDRVPAKTEMTLRNILLNIQQEVSLHSTDGVIQVEGHLSEGLLRSGVLKNSLSPCDSVITSVFRSKTEIFSEFENLLNKNVRERELEAFLTKYYKDIFGPRYEQIEAQVWLRFPELDIDGKNRRFDIFLRNAVEKDWELIELKKPKRIISNYRDIPVISAEILGAIAQLRNYEKILQQQKVKDKLHSEGIEYFEPQLRLVLGGKPDISTAQWRRIKSENENGLKIATTEEMLNEMRYRLSDYFSVIEGVDKA